MEKIFLPEGKGIKANLHCHSTDSDGKLSPEELKKIYKSQGYSVLAFTDHGFMRDRSALCDEDFVALNGYENNIIDGGNWIDCKAYHLNFYASSPDAVGMVGVTKSFTDYYMCKKTPEEKLSSPVIRFLGEGYGAEFVNEAIRQAKEQGYLVVYNHPVWSRHNGADYLPLQGLCGMEIFNYGCYFAGYEEDNGYIYDEMLRSGQRLFCFANDDNHNFTKDSFGGFNVMYPGRLDYKSVFDCMARGDCYASTGGYFRGVAVVGNKVYVGAENAAYIRFTTNGRYSDIVRKKERPLTKAVFELKEDVTYFRITMKSEDGKKAYTRAYFNDEWS